MKFVAGLLALSVLLAACADDPETSTDAGETSDAATKEEAKTDSAGSSDDSSAAESEDPAGTDNPAADGAGSDSAADDEPTDNDTGAADDSGSAGDIPPFLQAFALGSGVDINDEIVQCIQDRDVNLDVSPAAPTEEELSAIALGLFLCAPEQVGQAFAADITPPPGTDSDDVACVVVETFHFLASIPEAEALALFESDELSEDARGAVVEGAEQACGLDSDQIIAILDA